MVNKYGRLEEEGAPPQYSDVVGGQQPPSQAATPVVAPGAPVYVITRNPGAGPPPVVGQPQVITLQPQGPIIPDNEAPDHLAMAILVASFCCVPLGIIAIWSAMECRSARRRGDGDNALQSSRDAKKYSMAGLGCGGVLLAILIAYNVAIRMS